MGVEGLLVPEVPLEEESDGLSAGAIGGIAAGGAVGLCAIAAGIYFLVVKRIVRKERSTDPVLDRIHVDADVKHTLHEELQQMNSSETPAQHPPSSKGAPGASGEAKVQSSGSTASRARKLQIEAKPQKGVIEKMETQSEASTSQGVAVPPHHKEHSDELAPQAAQLRGRIQM